MKRLMRIFLNAATVLSLLLCVVSTVLWIRGRSVTDFVGWSGSERCVGILTGDGRARLQFIDDASVSPGWEFHIGDVLRPGRYGSTWDSDLRGADFLGGRWGVAYSIGMTGPGPFRHGGRAWRSLYIPHWLSTLLTAVPAMLALTLRFRRKRKILAGHCPTCGYDLRATPDRCPECGTVTKPAGHI
jgi:hypothetical protein